MCINMQAGFTALLHRTVFSSNYAYTALFSREDCLQSLPVLGKMSKVQACHLTMDLRYLLYIFFKWQCGGGGEWTTEGGIFQLWISALK